MGQNGQFFTVAIRYHINYSQTFEFYNNNNKVANRILANVYITFLKALKQLRQSPLLLATATIPAHNQAHYINWVTNNFVSFMSSLKCIRPMPNNRVHAPCNWMLGMT